VVSVGFIEYAWSIFFAKDQLKTKLLVDPEFLYPKLFRDQRGFVASLPEPKIGEESISFLGYDFPSNAHGKHQVMRLFRAAVFHLGAHVVSSSFEDLAEWKDGKEPRLARFTETLIEDARANAYLLSRHPEKIADLAFANALALRRMRSLERLMNKATKVMTSLLLYVNTGLTDECMTEEKKAIKDLTVKLDQVKEKCTLSINDNSAESLDETLRVADEVYNALEDYSPIVELPSLPHTENLGACSVFPPYTVNPNEDFEKPYNECLKALGGNSNLHESDESSGKLSEAEALQVFDTWTHRREKEGKLISKYEGLVSSTKFKSIKFPMQDYTEYLRARTRCKSEAHRLIESLLVARDALDEDPRKLYGVLDLQEVIQVIASKSPRMDVFMLDENLSKSYSWIILLDASRSMWHLREETLDVCVMLAEAAKELLIDPTSWGIYAFNDEFFIIKDMSERYNARVKSRIGGIKFKGFTYLPDAIEVAGQMMKGRSENLRLITVISDGWPYGYPNIDAALTEIADSLDKSQITIIGVGVKSKKMESFFRLNFSVYTLKDLTKRFSNLYLEASRVAAGM